MSSGGSAAPLHSAPPQSSLAAAAPLSLPTRTLRPDIPASQKTRGDLVIEFLQTLKLPDGPDAGKPIVLRDWQIRDIKRIYDPLTTSGVHRAVRSAVWTMGRKNGKSSLAGGLLLTHLVGPEAGWNQQIYSAAFEREQAALIYHIAESMVMLDSELAAICRCTDTNKKIRCNANLSMYHALSAETRSKHGLNPAFVIFDELAQFHTDRALFDVLQTAFGAQAEPLMLTISTQAANDEAVLSQLIDYGREVNEGRLVDDSFVLIDYSTPNDEELEKLGLSVWDEEVWKMGNPGLGDFRSLDEMRSFALKAKRLPSLELTFRNLYLNQRTASRASFVSPSVWELCKDAIPDEEIEGCAAVIALDLSARLDLTAFVIAILLADGRIALRTYAFTPEHELEERAKRDRAPYIDWAKMGLLTVVPGKSIEYDFVARHLLDECARLKLDVQRLVYDRWRIEDFKKAMARQEQEGTADITFSEDQYVAFGQGFKDMSPAVEAFEEKLVIEQIAHGGNPLLRWAIANAVLEKDAAGNKKLTKAKSYGRIDPAVAAVMAVGGMVRATDLSAAPGIAVV